MTGPQHDTEATDAHLQAALRHAPDRELAPPPQLGALLSRAARAAVAQTAQSAWWQRLWTAMAAPRPVWAGALGALLVASLTLRLWWGEAPPPVESPEAREAAVGAAPQATAPVAPPAPAAPAATAAAPPTVMAAPPPPPPVVEPRTTATPSAAARPRAAAAPQAPRAESMGRSDAAPAAADNRPPPEPAPATPTAPAAVPAAAPPPAPAPATMAAPDASRAAPAAKAMAPQPMQESLLRAPAPSPLRAMRDRASAAPQDSGDWRWQSPASPAPQAMDAAAQATLARIDQASRGKWKPDTQAASESAAPTLRWWLGDRLQGTLRIEPDALRFTDAAGARWRADLPPDILAALLPP